MIIGYFVILGIVAFFSLGTDFTSPGIMQNSFSQQVVPCSVPQSGNMIVDSDCTLLSNSIAPENISIQNNSVLTIPDAITLGVDFENFNLTVFSGSGLLIQSGGSIKQQSTQNEFTDCSDGWKVTGYTIPLEVEFVEGFITIIVEGQTRQFKQDFVDAIKIQGWGETLAGDYLGWYSNSYHLNDNAVDANGNVLVEGIVAVDPALIDPSSNLMIPSLPDPWNEIVFQGSDTGGGINGKHIDVFTGEGFAAADEARRITGTNNTVCQ